MLFGTVVLSAQGSDVDIQGTLRFSSLEHPTLGPNIINYGTGTLYTDSTDRAYEDEIPPFGALPGSFVFAFLRPCSDDEVICWWNQDLRGIPDSVTEGGVTRFELRYTITISNGTNQGFRVGINNNDWPLGVDSIKIFDRVLPRAYTQVFTGPTIDTIDDPETSILDVTVYYNLRTLSVDRDATVESALAIAPNPLRGENLSLQGRFDGNDRLLLVDALGRTVDEKMVTEETTQIAWHALGIPTGVYYLLHFDEKGLLRGRRQLTVIR
jgi:hypothetical protein